MLLQKMTGAQTLGKKGRRRGGLGLLASTLLLASMVLLLLPLPAVAQTVYKDERPPFDEFLNYGKKKVKPGRELENEVIKSKVEVLGEILKTHVQKLRQVGHFGCCRVFPLQGFVKEYWVKYHSWLHYYDRPL